MGSAGQDYNFFWKKLPGKRTFALFYEASSNARVSFCIKTSPGPSQGPKTGSPNAKKSSKKLQKPMLNFLETKKLKSENGSTDVQCCDFAPENSKKKYSLKICTFFSYPKPFVFFFVCLYGEIIPSTFFYIFF